MLSDVVIVLCLPNDWHGFLFIPYVTITLGAVNKIRFRQGR